MKVSKYNIRLDGNKAKFIQPPRDSIEPEAMWKAKRTKLLSALFVFVMFMIGILHWHWRYIEKLAMLNFQLICNFYFNSLTYSICHLHTQADLVNLTKWQCIFKQKHAQHLVIFFDFCAIQFTFRQLSKTISHRNMNENEHWIIAILLLLPLWYAPNTSHTIAFDIDWSNSNLSVLHE